jgi:hypothetical protein
VCAHYAVLDANHHLPALYVDLKGFLEQYVQKMVSLFAAAHADYETRGCAEKQAEHNIVTKDTPWSVIPYFCKLPEMITQCDTRLPTVEQEEYILWWRQKTDIESLITVPPHIIADRVLAERLSPIIKELMADRPALVGAKKEAKEKITDESPTISRICGTATLFQPIEGAARLPSDTEEPCAPAKPKNSLFG